MQKHLKTFFFHIIIVETSLSRIIVPDWWYHPLPVSGQVYPPCLLTMPNYSQQRREADQWFSPAFYTGPGGYRMCLRVRAVGQGSGLGSHVSVFVHLMRSENDDKLKWPLSAEVIVRLVNFRENNNHKDLRVNFNSKLLPNCCARVHNRDMAEKGIGLETFVEQEKLRLNTEKNTEFLRNDCISFLITNAKIL